MKSMNGWLGSCMAWGAAAIIAGASAGAYAVHDISIFELDRNAVDSGTAAALPDDWDTVNLPLPNGTGGHSFAHTGVIADPTPEGSIFTSGGSKDDLDISSWKWKKASNILDKDNITNAYAAAYNVNNHLVIYFGLDRISNDGSAQVGFWFLKNAISLNGNGTSGGGDTFSGVHANGDILVQSNFSQGGVVSTVTVFEWQNGALVQIASGGDCTTASGDNVCATVNQDADPSSNVAPWPYTPKSGAAGFFPHGTFFEGGIDLTALGLTDACFSTFLAETRSSTTFNSVLKDFVGPHAFDTCNIEVTKSCTNPRLNAAQNRIIYDISGKVTASGFGSNLFDVALSDSPVADGAFQWVDCADPSTVLGSFPLATLNGDACYKNTMTVLLTQNGLKDTVTATAHTQDNGGGVALTASAEAQCPNLQLSPALKVEKDCVTSVAVQNNTVVAKVTVSGRVCNIGDSNLTNVTVDDLNITTTPDPLVNNVSILKGAPCVEYSGTYIPTAANDANGNPTTCPSDVVFKDTVRATAKDIFGADVTPQTDMAECPLCPVGGCPQ
jgi:hypothetical protein